MTPTRISRRLNRILLMIPYAIAHPGVPIDDLAQRFGARREDLLDDLEMVFMCGLPGYGPGDLIDVDLTDERVTIRMADYFRAPLRITPAEALVLLASGNALASLPGMENADALRRGLAKLQDALGGAAGVEVRLESSPEEHLKAIEEALEQRRKIVMEYHSASSGELRTRTVDPWGLITALGRWYVVGRDGSSDEERMFRIDRIKSVALGEPGAGPPPDFDPSRYKGGFSGDGRRSLTLEISPQAARWFEGYYPVTSSRPLPDGWQAVELVAGGAMWAAVLVLRLGTHVRNVGDAEVTALVRDLAGKIAGAHST